MFHYHNVATLTRTALNRLSWNSRDNQVGMTGHELPPSDVYWLRLSLPLGELQTRFRSILLLHSIATIVVARARIEWKWKSRHLIVIPRPRHITFPPYLSPSSLVPESIPALAIRNCPNLFPRPATAKPTLYHEVSTTRGESGSLFAGNDTDRPDFIGLHPG